MNPELQNTEKNLERMQEFIEQIKQQCEHIHLIVFPELITSGYECGREFQHLAESADRGHSVKTIQKLAQKYHTDIIFGFPERDQLESSVLYNSTAYIDSNGDLKNIYRKVHLFDTEKKYFKPGTNFPLIQTSFGKIGIMICWDTAFPEVARIYALKGADLLAVSTNWENPYSSDWDLIVRARAFDNCLPLVAANRIGSDHTLSFFGHSKIISPLGKPIKSIDSEVEGYISSAIDLNQSRKLRQQYYTFFNDRKPLLYEMISQV